MEVTEPCWFEWLEKPHLLLAHGVSRRFVRLLWSPPTSPCPINHFLSKLSLFDWGNQEFPLYLPLISKPALPLNIKWWFWDDPRTGRTTWWAKSDVIYCICACAKASETVRCNHAERHRFTHQATCATKISCHFTAFSRISRFQLFTVPVVKEHSCKCPVRYSINSWSSWPRQSSLFFACPPRGLSLFSSEGLGGARSSGFISWV